MSETVGVIGLGVLGSAIAANLNAGDLDVIGCDVRPEAVDELVAQGAGSAASPREVAERSDVVLLCLPNSDALRTVVSGPDGLVHSPKNPQIVIESSTFAIADKEWARDALLTVGKTLLDVPVSGNRILALRKQLTAFASGDEAACRQVEHVIMGYCRASHYVGGFGAGMKMKFCANILNLVHNSVAAEVMVLGIKSGLDPQLIHDVISGSGSSSSMFETRGALMARNDYDHEGMNFSVPLKDSRLISAHAAALLCPTPIYQAALQPYYAAVAQGHHDEDSAAVCAAMELAANCTR
jgi:3-hydroxyisobutyrate dehydrogenase-like beta-hydroxyacid dehydrogenase